MIGIYYWYNTKTNQYYIGQSVDIFKRKLQHELASKKPNPTNSLYRSMQKHGLKAFIFGVLEECKIEELDEREIFYIELFDSYKHGLNDTKGGQKYFSIGESNPNTKLTNEEVLSIRERIFKKKEDMWEVYEDFKDKIGREGFWSLVHGNTWKSVDTSMIERLDKDKFKGEKNPKAVLTEQEVKSIRYRYEMEGESWAAIYEDYKDKISKEEFKNIINYKTWKEVSYEPVSTKAEA